MDDEPFYCNMGALSSSERAVHLELTTRLAQAIVTTSELADGFRFELDRGQLSIAELGSWADFERRCCPFFDFQLELHRHDGPLSLRLSGREGVKAFIRAEFPQPFAG